MDRIRPHFTHALLLRGAPLFVLFVLAGVSPARAHTTIVPDDFPTIQAAVNNVAEDHAVAETLLVRGARYPERVVVLRRNVVIRGIPPLVGPDRMPEIAGLVVGGTTIECAFIGLYFTDPVNVDSWNLDRLLFAGCTFAAYLYANPIGYGASHALRLTGCTCWQGVLMGGRTATLDSSTVHGPVFIGPADSALVLDNRFENGALTISYTRALVARNRVRGGGGFEAHAEGGVRFEDNDIEGCPGGGIYSEAWGTGDTRIERNRIAHCGQPRMDHFGIRVHGRGTVRGNFVLDCRGPGIDVDQLEGAGGAIEDNVVGRCDLAGIRLTNQYPGLRLPGSATMSVRGNTVYACAGPGIAISSLPSSTIANNLVYACDGLSALDSDPLLISHNDWFPASAPGSPTDLSVDPQFCDLSADDVRLRSDSPLLDVPGAGRIGALGIGCEAPPVAIGLEVRQDVLPLPSRGGRVTAWLEPGTPFTASEIEIATVRLNGVPVASAEGILGDHDRDGVADLQLRFDRAAVGRTLGDSAVATVTGRMRGRRFVGSCELRLPGSRGVGRSVQPDPGSADPVLTIRPPVFNGASGGFRVAFTLVDASPARLELLDVAGRVVLSRDVQGSGPGERAIELAGGGRLAQGIYFLRLRQGTSEARARAAIVR